MYYSKIMIVVSIYFSAVLLLLFSAPSMAITNNTDAGTVIGQPVNYSPEPDQTVCACDPDESAPKPKPDPTTPTPVSTVIISGGETSTYTYSISGGSTKTLDYSTTGTRTLSSRNNSSYHISTSASASASGEDAIAISHTNITSNSAISLSIAEAKAVNGSTATASSKAQGSWLGNTIATAHAVVTVVAQIGETVWAQAIAFVTVSSDGTAQSQSRAIVSKTHNIEARSIISSGNTITLSSGKTTTMVSSNSANLTVNTPTNTTAPSTASTPYMIKSYDNGFGGYSFGGSAIERYCVYKIQIGTTKNATKHAIYSMNIIASDEGYHTEEEFEQKYNLNDATCNSIVGNYSHRTTGWQP